MIKFLIGFLFSLLLLNLSYGENYQNNTQNSWHWYHDPVVKKSKKPKVKSVTLKTLPIDQQVAILHYYTINAERKAVLYPSIKHQMQYVKWQNFWTDHASDSTQNWVHLNLLHPELNYATNHSTVNKSAGIYGRVKSQKTQKAIDALSKNYGLIFFYRRDSGFSEDMAKLVSSFARAHHFVLIPISMDGYRSPYLPNTIDDQGQAKHMKDKIFPSLYLVNPKTGDYQAIFYTYSALDQIQSVMLNIANSWKRDF